MNLTTLVERACLESGYNDTDDVTAGKKFARHWDEHIWNAALWKNALVACDIAVTPATNADHAAGIVYCPEVIDRVVAVRTTDSAPLIQAQERYFRLDYDVFAQTGKPLEYHLLPPALLSFAESIYFSSRVDADAGEVVKVITAAATTGEQTTQSLTLASTAGDGNTITGSGTVLRVFKEETQGHVGILTVAAATLLKLVAPGATTAPLYQRIRLVPIPDADITVRVLGKAKYEPLDYDQQEPGLQNCTNALLAFIRGSLKRRGGENGAAQAEFAEANALLKQVIQIEALQAANHQRFTPEDGFGLERLW